MRKFMIGILAIMLSVSPVVDALAKAGKGGSFGTSKSYTPKALSIPKSSSTPKIESKPAYEPKALTLGDKGPSKVVPQEKAKPLAPQTVQRTDEPKPMYNRETTRVAPSYTPSYNPPPVQQPSAFTSFLVGMGLGWFVGHNSEPPLAAPVQAAPVPVQTAPVQTGPSKEFYYWNTKTEKVCTADEFKDKSFPCEVRPGKPPKEGEVFDKDWEKGAQ